MAYFDTKSGSLEESIRKAVINEEPKMDKVNPDAVKKKFKDRKDKDIDNDGDVDSTDKYLHKRRKAISKAMGEEISPDEYESIIETLAENDDWANVELVDFTLVHKGGNEYKGFIELIVENPVADLFNTTFENDYVELKKI